MRLKLTLLLLLAAALPALAQQTGVSGTVVDAYTGAPVSGANVMLNNQGAGSITGPSGDFLITADVSAGTDALVVAAYGYADGWFDVSIAPGRVTEMGKLQLKPENLVNLYYEEQQNDMLFDQNTIDDEESAQQAVATLTGASDDIYFNSANYNWHPMSFRFRGYDNEYSQTLVNGLLLNDLARGRFNYSSFGGMNRAVRNKKIAIGLAPSAYSFGDIAGVTEVDAFASNYAAGFYGSAAYTNSNYMFRAMAQYATGLNAKGWAFMVSAIGRYAKEGVIEGTWYESFGLFGSIQKVLNRQHSLNLTFFGAPTQRAGASATYQEAYDLAGTNYYNPNWGWQDGKKRNARVTRTFDPTAILNWLWKKNRNVTLNTAVGARWVNYQNTALNWYNAPDPRPDYYRYLPSYYAPDGTSETNPSYDYQLETYDYYTDMWENDADFRQIDWDRLYAINRLNSAIGPSTDGVRRGGSSYIVEARHSDQFNLLFSSTLSSRLSDVLTLQGGVNFNYTNAHYFKTIDDLLGGDYWVDVDQYAERDDPGNPDFLQNNLNDPDRKVVKGDTFGYDYNIHAIQAGAWLQNVINLPRWDINYALNLGYTQFYRYGNMRNGRAPNNSYGKSRTHKFDTGGIKLGATYKIDGHNYLMAHASYETKAPRFDYAYLAPRIKDDVITGLCPERILSGDLSYGWNYRRFRGQVTGFWTEMSNLNERTSFYDDLFSTYMNYVLAGVRKRYQGVEVGLAYKVTSAVTVTAAGTYSRYRYCNNPYGTRSYENGMAADTTQRVYLKNFYVGCRPQTAFNIGVDWAAPKSWFFNVNVSWMGDSYVSLSPIHHEAMPDLVSTLRANTEILYPYEDSEVIFRDLPIEAQEQVVDEKVKQISGQEKLKNGYSLNASIGKMVRINRQVSLNFNLRVDNITNNRNMVYNAYQQGRFDYTNYDTSRYPNRYSYAQGIKVMFTAGVRF